VIFCVATLANTEPGVAHSCELQPRLAAVATATPAQTGAGESACPLQGLAKACQLPLLTSMMARAVCNKPTCIGIKLRVDVIRAQMPGVSQ